MMLSHLSLLKGVKKWCNSETSSNFYRFFSKKRIVVDEQFMVKPKVKSDVIQLVPFNKIKTIAKRSFLPPAHILKALCVKEGKEYYLTDEEGKKHCFGNEKDIIIPYSLAETYLHNCKKKCECIDIDPENMQNSYSNNKKWDGQTIKRQPVISVVGEMDHGKTTLLDYFLHTHYQKQEFGGTTQIIRASDLVLNQSNQSKQSHCTVLDTPGQSCFSYIRENGSILSDFTIYVISLYEGLSQEASVIFQQLKDNGVPVLIVYTKQDLVNQERQQQVIQQVKQLIKEYSISLLDSQVISCVTGFGIPELEEKLWNYSHQLQKEVPKTIPAEATIIDSSIIPSQGIVMKALIQQGVLSIRDPFICGLYTGNVRNLLDLHSQRIEHATPGMVVNVLGAKKLPASLRKTNHLLPTGDTLFVRSTKEIDEIMEQRLFEYAYQNSICEDEIEEEEELTGKTEIIDGEEYMEVESHPVILIADNANSMNILVDEINSLPGMNIIQTRIGQITDHDIQQCKESNSTIISFNIPLPTKAHLDKNHFIYAKIMNHLLDKVKKQF